MRGGVRAATAMISRAATRISRLAKPPGTSSSSSSSRLFDAAAVDRSRPRFDHRTLSRIRFQATSERPLYQSSFLPAMFLMGAFGAGAVQISYADASEEDYNLHAVEDSWSGSVGADKIVRQVRQRLEELLRTKGMQRGSYPTFTVSAKGNKVTIKFRVPPACEISHLIVNIVKHLGEKAEHYGGGSEMLLRAWDSFSSLLLPFFLPTAASSSYGWFASRLALELEIEFIKQGSYSFKELEAVVSALKLAGERSNIKKSSGRNPNVFKRDDNYDAKQLASVEKSVSALEGMGVRVYGLDETSSFPWDGTVSWENIAGYDEQKREIEDTILLALQSPEIYDEIARGTRCKFETNRPRAVLFEGPPGTGKTSSARVIAKQAGVPLLYVPLEVIMSKYYGESERLLGNVFSLANELPSGAIIFLDEVDSFAVARDSEMHEATRRILSVILRQIDGFEQEKQVVVIAATNRKQDLDPALISRFDSLILFSLPDQKTREEIAAQYAKHLLKTELVLLASATEGMSGRDIRDVCQQAERHWASKRIRGQAPKDAEGGGKLPPIEEYIQSAEQRREAVYIGEKFTPKGNAFVLHGGSEGLYASLPHANANATATAGRGDSFIRFEKITFTRPEKSVENSKDADSVLVQAIIFEVEDRETIGGSAYGGQRAVCCTPDLAKLGACTQGTVIYRPSAQNPKWPQVLAVTFNGKDLVATLPSQSIPITRTGMYNLYFIYCDPALNGLVIDGKTVWKNPTGYLPGRMAPLMNFYGFMSLAFVILGIFWFSQYVRFWREVLPLQNCITLVIALGMLEMALWYFEYAEFNETGLRPMGITFWAVTFGTVKRTVSWVIILVVSMGYGVVRPTLGGLTSKVIMLGATFFLASEILELVENAGAVSDFAGKARLFLVLPVALLDAFFIIWIFTSLSKTLDKLQARRLIAKLDIYRKFTNALAVTVIVSVGWICYELYFKSNDVYNGHWQNAWIIPVFWQVLSFSLLCVIAALWAPSQNSMRYAYSDDGSEEFDREDSLSLIKPGPVSSKDPRGSAGLMDARAAVSNDTATSHNGDIEEDKRE
ncbi:Holliday junction DNA helicase ruvB N-terminus [Musa troglodytarum]|uniref:Holliday junction DNA helicase ruvB N-terminus n=1 Tax=Musa troglodytarum TaxID=320322 RepID=A0A9E7GIZ7_9LILI|nr:Holliday junction DNA helicase ruvB N-terminus [Musa troglodytarum]